jgi:hypothetical protein
MPDATDQPIIERLPDGGPIYVETPGDPYTNPSWVAEPWNTATAALFIIIPLAWLWHLRGKWARHPFVVCCLPILLTGGIGGTLFHGLRKYRAFFLMDVIPIYFLGVAVSVYLWIRLRPRFSHLLGLIAFVAVTQLVWAGSQLPIQWRINVSYASLALLVLIPILVVLVRTHFQHARWIYTALACFAIAWISRIADKERPPLLPMGTHWLWHTFGAITTASVIMYVYRIEALSLRKNSTPTATAETPVIE